MFILELDRHVDKSVLMLLVAAMPMVGMIVSAVLLVFVRIIVFRVHAIPQRMPTFKAQSPKYMLKRNKINVVKLLTIVV
jgi:cell division protein FtsN